MKKLPVLLALCACLAYAGPKWESLFNGKDLNGWEVVGDGVWNVLSDGTMVGQRHLGKADRQSWLYTKEEFGDFEFEMDFWSRLDGNSGVSILDTSRGRYAQGVEHGATPSGMLKAWYGGVWGSQNIFTFAFQMVLILVTGYTLAEAPVLKRAIVHIAGKPNNQVQGALLCFTVSAVLSLLNWGLGLVAGALVAT